MWKRAKVALAMMCAGLTILVGASANGQQTPPNGYQQDFRLMVDTLRARHPGIPASPLPMMAPDAFDREWRAVDRRLASVTSPTAFYFEVMAFLASLHDGHANLSLSMRGQRVLPVLMHWFGDRLYVLATLDAAYRHLALHEVRAIGGVPVLALERRLAMVLPSDVGAPARQRKAYFGSSFFMGVESFLDHLGVARGAGAEVVFADVSRERTVHLPFVEATPAHMPTYTALARNDITKPGDASFFKAYPTLSTVYVQIASQAANVDAAFFGRVFAETRAHQCRIIVVDIREWSGGDSEPVLELFRHLVDRPVKASLYRSWQREGAGNVLVSDGQFTIEPIGGSRRFEGRVFLLTGPNTFSAATFPVVLALDNGLATVVGEACGNGSARYGMVERLKLPHSGLTFQYSTRIWERAKRGLGDPQLGIEPHVRIVPTVGDYRAGRDPVWDYVLASAGVR